MAQSDEEIQLRGKARRRLVGAVGLVLVAAVVLPLVLESKPKPMNQDIAIEIPKPGDSSLGAAVPAKPPAATPYGAMATPPAEAVPPTPDIPVSKPAPVAPTPAKPAEKPAAKPAEKPASKPTSKPADKPADKPAEKPAASPPAAPAKAPAKPAAGAFVIQVAALANADNARQLQDKLAASGVKAYTDTVKGANGTLTRVRVGPFGSREEADKALDKVKKLGVDGKVVPK